MFFVLFLAIFVTKSACDNLALKTSTAKVSDSGVVIYLSQLRLLSLFSISATLLLLSVSLTRLLTLGILFSTVVNAVFVAKLLTSGFLPSISAILAL